MPSLPLPPPFSQLILHDVLCVPDLKICEKLELREASGIYECLQKCILCCYPIENAFRGGQRNKRLKFKKIRFAHSSIINLENFPTLHPQFISVVKRVILGAIVRKNIAFLKYI